jgi:transcriptional regulator with XRE-family HTH domain
MENGTDPGSRQAAKIDRHVGERIRRRRTVLGYTQEQLADSLSISYQQVQKYETGTNRVSAGRLFQIANRLEVQVSFFFEGISEVNADAGVGEVVPANAGNRATIELVRNFNGIPDPTIRSAVAGLVKILADRDLELTNEQTDSHGHPANGGGRGMGVQAAFERQMNGHSSNGNGSHTPHANGNGHMNVNPTNGHAANGSANGHGSNGHGESE